MSINVALVSPTKEAYSETFIQAHRNINANVFYYYGDFLPQFLDGYGYIGPKKEPLSRLLRFIDRKIRKPKLNINEQAFIESLKKNKIDAVLAEYGQTGVGVLNACKAHKIPLVTIFHGYDASVKGVVNSYLDRYKMLFAYSRKIIAVSSLMKSNLIKMGCPDEKIIHTPCAPNDLFLSLVPTFTEPRSFVAIGRFVDKKAPYYTILAIKKVAEKYPDVKLYFAGEGELLESCRNLVKYLKLENNVQLLGRITPQKYANLLTKVTGLIQHSITSENGDMEGTPVSVLEASAAGIPVIATRHAGIQDVITDGKTGFLVDEHDVDTMALKIEKLILNSQLVKIMGKNGKRRIIENFTMEKHLNLISNSLRL